MCALTRIARLCARIYCHLPTRLSSFASEKSGRERRVLPAEPSHHGTVASFIDSDFKLGMKAQ